MEKVLKHNLPRLNFRWGNLVEILYAVLIPFALLWAVFTFLRRKYYPKEKAYRSQLPVISIGNIHSGGSGKTPVVQALCAQYKEKLPAVVSRGYKASLSAKGAKVNMQGAFAVGDEAWMLHTLFDLNVWIGKDRVKNIKKIETTKSAGLLILDDGFQHFKVQRDIDLVLIDTNRSPKESFCLPLGNLREPLSALSAASAVVLTGSKTESFVEWRAALKQDFSGLEVFEARLKVEGLYYGTQPHPEFRAKKLLGFSGIANNQRFVQTLSSLPAATYYKGFADHFSYSQEDADQIISHGMEEEVEAYVTTDKDWVKVNRFFKENDELVLSLRIGYEFPREFWSFVNERLEGKC